MTFVPISINNYVKKHLKNNPDENEKELRKRLQNALDAYNRGERCDCGNDIWVIGTGNQPRLHQTTSSSVKRAFEKNNQKKDTPSRTSLFHFNIHKLFQLFILSIWFVFGPGFRILFHFFLQDFNAFTQLSVFPV